MGHILVGTTSWAERTLLESGQFYPPGCKTAEDRLRYYAGHFPIVEVDSSYYGLPSERNAVLWAERTPEGFTFDVKAFRLFTQHRTPLGAFPADLRKELEQFERRSLYYQDLPKGLADEMWARFRSALEPLKQAGKLGVVLFQFAPWFVFRPSHLGHLVHCAEKLDGCRLAVEFRNASWFWPRHRKDVLDFERENGLAHVVVDEPQGFSSSIPPLWEVTCANVAVLRLHGRNRQTWEKKNLATAAERFNYLYSKDELEEFADPVQHLAESAKEVHVLFNNCYRDHAQRNAADLARLLQK